MSTFNPFDFFFTPDAELNKTVSYLRDCMNTHDTTEFPPQTNEWEVRGTPPPGDGLRGSGSFRHAVNRLRRRIARR
jgi:hypothetical protein